MAAAPFIAAVLIFVALTLAITWPAASVVGIRLIGDLGDPLFVTWVMTWVMSHLSRAAGGDVSALEGFWHANIFYPERYTLAYSEHFVGQSLQVLPLWWITGNAVLSYNLVVLSTFVLTGLGTFLLTRALTGGWVGPLLAGVMATFNPYRLELELSHLHVLSIQWLPLALVAVHGFIRSGSRRYLLATALCVLALNLSSVYFMLFCAPVLALFTLVDLTLEGKLRDSSRWAGLAVAGAGIVLMTAPFVLPYWRVNLEMGFERSFAEIRAHSATLSQYAEYLLPWAHLPLLFAALGAVAAFLPRPPASRALILTVIGLLALVFVLSLGPVLPVAQVRGPYWLLYEYVPGFRGLRVVNRYGALVLIFLPVLAGVGAAWAARWPRFGPVAVLGATAGFLWQVWPAAMPINAALPSPGLQPAPRYLNPAPTLPNIYRAVQTLDRDAVLAEFPFGDPWFDIRYMFFSATHQRRLMNGYSGVLPPTYLWRQRVFANPLEHPETVISALQGATHVLVHSSVWPDDTGPQLVAWLITHDASRLFDADGATLLAVGATARHAQQYADPR
ncbi:MAG: hypothetical protein LC791_15685 [Acidobacteria bacterium]|nr:hypothetical protein [Acidobacteriota bacterium]